jgi:hypothetical protein
MDKWQYLLLTCNSSLLFIYLKFIYIASYMQRSFVELDEH